MLEVLEVREGSFEISDQFQNEDRLRIKKYKILLTGLIYILAILLLIVILDLLINFTNFSRIGVSMFLILIILVEMAGLFALTKFKQLLPESISGIFLLFDAHKKLDVIRVRRWTNQSFNEYSEEEIRHNQSIGFQAILMEDGDMQIELIVDPTFPGIQMFMTYDMDTLAEFILLFRKISPDMDKWYYKQENDEEWPQELITELELSIQQATVPLAIRSYYG